MSANREVIANTASVLGYSELNHQETKFIQAVLRGLPLKLAAEQAGYHGDEAQIIVSQPHIAQTLTYLREQNMVQQFDVTRDMVNMMLFEAYGAASNATEMVGAAREIGKLNGLYAPTKVEHNVNHEQKTEQQLKQLSSAELAKLAGNEDVIDGEWEEINE